MAASAALSLLLSPAFVVLQPDIVVTACRPLPAGNNHDLMFLKQWLAASDAGVETMFYYDFSRKSSHSIFPLIRKLQHMNVGQLWGAWQQQKQ